MSPAEPTPATELTPEELDRRIASAFRHTTIKTFADVPDWARTLLQGVYLHAGLLITAGRMRAAIDALRRYMRQ
jgi:hypothetical protein